tara:strand:- start:433 stop:708 length:276 start_codon:yes stop_codon:yes gene_type:complete
MKLVEDNIKYIMNSYLKEMNEHNQVKKNVYFNLFLLFIIIFTISITLYIKYKGKQNVSKIREKERKKKEYILSNLRKYQNMKNELLTNIPN